MATSISMLNGYGKSQRSMTSRTSDKQQVLQDGTFSLQPNGKYLCVCGTQLLKASIKRHLASIKHLEKVSGQVVRGSSRTGKDSNTRHLENTRNMAHSVINSKNEVAQALQDGTFSLQPNGKYLCVCGTQLLKASIKRHLASIKHLEKVSGQVVRGSSRTGKDSNTRHLENTRNMAHSVINSKNEVAQALQDGTFTLQPNGKYLCVCGTQLLKASIKRHLASDKHKRMTAPHMRSRTGREQSTGSEGRLTSNEEKGAVRKSQKQANFRLGFAPRTNGTTATVREGERRRREHQKYDDNKPSLERKTRESTEESDSDSTDDSEEEESLGEEEEEESLGEEEEEEEESLGEEEEEEESLGEEEEEEEESLGEEEEEEESLGEEEEEENQEEKEEERGQKYENNEQNQEEEEQSQEEEEENQEEKEEEQSQEEKEEERGQEYEKNEQSQEESEEEFHLQQPWTEHSKREEGELSEEELNLTQLYEQEDTEEEEAFGLRQLYDSELSKGESQSKEEDNTSTESYRMASHPRGNVYVFNYKFTGKHNQRDGADYDSESIQKTFTDMGYRVFVKEDLSRRATLMELKLIRDGESIRNVDSLVMFFLSHGKGVRDFLTEDGQSLCLSRIHRMFTDGQCPALRGKPKIFFANFCRRGAFETCPAFEVSDSPRDMVTVHAAGEGSGALRNASFGTYFIRNLCQVLQEHAGGKSLREIYLELDRSAAERGGTQPMWEDYVFRNFYFSPTKRRDEEIERYNNCR
ncbi:uncharacterized protein [Penaeus vannamei]|uniref:uncharacterized protein isoform X5 n=1 Tax=Penaeus vannamei TaxID=6689 RepID=UPI00387F38AA